MINRESEGKAEFLVSFARFTEWPSSAFATKDSPLVIAILGAVPWDTWLEEKLRGQTVRGRRLEVEHIPEMRDMRTCHMVYVGRTEVERLGQMVEALRGKPVLIVSDVERAKATGVMIRLFEDHHRIRLEVNLEAVRRAGLHLSAKLLRAAYAMVPAENP